MNVFEGEFAIYIAGSLVTEKDISPHHTPSRLTVCAHMHIFTMLFTCEQAATGIVTDRKLNTISKLEQTSEIQFAEYSGWTVVQSGTYQLIHSLTLLPLIPLEEMELKHELPK